MSSVRTLLALSVLSLGCTEAGGATDRSNREALEEVEIGYSALRISAPVLLAEQRGLFARHGLSATLRRYETAQPLVEEVLDGRIPCGGYAAIPIVATAVARGGTAPRLATSLIEDGGHPITRLIRRRGETGIAGPADLVGRRVGILPTVAYRAWLQAVLAAAHVDPAQVEIVPLPPPQQVPALLEGGVDALFTNDPMATAAIATGAGELAGGPAPVPAALGRPVLFGSFLIGDGFARERPEAAARVVAALDEAIAILDREPGAAAAAIAPFVRAPERAYVELYPPGRWLPNASTGQTAIAEELASEVRAGILDGPVEVHAW